MSARIGMPVWFCHGTHGVKPAVVTAVWGDVVKVNEDKSVQCVDVEWKGAQDCKCTSKGVEFTDLVGVDIVGKCWERNPNDVICKGLNCNADGKLVPHSQECQDAHDRTIGAGTLDEKKHSFKMGDIVRLKSGGPEMSVQGVKDDRLMCVWWSEQHSDFGERWFAIETVKSY